tara:strand:+ start:201 stop:404 length:204 start_codon:yes stop_codon:yes gene_type:complete
MPDLKKCTLKELHDATDSELAEIIRRAITEFKKQQEYGIEGIISYTCEADEAVLMIAVQERYDIKRR